MHLFDPHFQAVNASGVPYAGAKLYFYQSGTTTQITIYQDSGKAASHTNPVVADAAGRFAPIWVDTTPYKWVLTTTAGLGTTIQTVDGVYANNTLSEGRFTIASGLTVDLDATEYAQGTITGTDKVTAITLADGHHRIVRADGAFSWGPSASLIVDGKVVGNDVQARAGDLFEIEGGAAGVTRVWTLARAAPMSQDGPHAIIEERQTSGTAAGAFNSGADRIRALNTEVYDPYSIVSVSSSQIVFAAVGSYHIVWSAPAFSVDGHQTILYNATSSTEKGRGSTEYAPATDNAQTRSWGSAVVVINANDAYELRHRCTTTKATNGAGVPASFGTEVYARVEITKVA